MSATTTPRDTPEMGDGPIASFMGGSIPSTNGLATAQLTPGTIIDFDPATQLYNSASANPTHVVVGIYQGEYDVIPVGAAQTFVPDIKQGVFKVAAGTGADAIPITTPPGTVLYLIDNQTVGLTSGDGTRQRAGKLAQVDYSGQPGATVYIPGVWVEMRATLFDGSATPSNASVQTGTARTVRAAITIALPTYAAVAGVLTATANGALGAQDGITLAVGDRVLLTAGAAAADNGIYSLTALGTAGTPWALTRVTDFVTGLVIPEMLVGVSEGSIYANTFFTLTTTGAIVVGTTALAFGLLQQPITHAVRGVIVAALGTYTRVGGVITANSVGAIGAQDGLTLLAGQRVLLAAGAAGADNGIYVVTSPGGAGAFVLTRPSDYPDGAVLPASHNVLVSEGTLCAGTTWFQGAAAATGITVDTTTTNWYPKALSQLASLTSGTVTITNVPILSDATSQVLCSLKTATSATNSVGYGSLGALTAGALTGGSPSATIDAFVVNMTKNGSDGSTIRVTILN